MVQFVWHSHSHYMVTVVKGNTNLIHQGEKAAAHMNLQQPLHTLYFYSINHVGESSTTELMLQQNELFLFYVYECFTCMHVYVPCTCSAWVSQEEEQDPLELE